MRIFAALALGCGLAACSSTPTYPTKTPPPATGPQTPSATPRPAVAQPPAQSAVPRQAAAGDQCGAAEMQRMIGRPRTEIPVPLDPSRQRVACTSCPVTQDFNPARLNFFFDADTGLIQQVRCG